MFLPDLHLGIAEPRRALRRFERDRAHSFDVTDLAGNSRHVNEVSALRESNQEIPILEEIECRIEAAHVEIGFARNEDRRQRNVVVEDQLLAIEVLAED